MSASQAELPLRYRTPESWAADALRDPHALLSDHAYLEKKAASNALELLNRWPEPHYPKKWTTTLSAVARDEALHLERVTRLLSKRGGKLERRHESTYASDLRALVRRGQGPLEIVDRLLVSALIEARSCERFHLLARNSKDKELAALYKSLGAAERGHYRVFLELARQVVSPIEVESRWDTMLTEEARIISQQPTGPRLHSGIVR